MKKNLIVTIIVGVIFGIGSFFGSRYISEQSRNSVLEKGFSTEKPLPADLTNAEAEKLTQLFAAVDADNGSVDEGDIEEPPATEYMHLVEEQYSNVVGNCDSLPYADGQLCYKMAIKSYLDALQRNGSAIQFASPKFPPEFIQRIRYIINDPKEEFGNCALQYKAQKINDKQFVLCVITIHNRVEMNIRVFQAGGWHDNL